MKYKIDWFATEKITEGLELPTTQIYCWVCTGDNLIALVSKDNKKWQFPGGKPKEGESEYETLEREVKEETSLSLTENGVVPKMFGYYIVTENEDDGTFVKKYLQLRYFVKLNILSKNISISPNENKDEIGNDEVKHSKWVSIDEAKTLIPWLSASGELNSFVKLVS